MLEGAAWHLPQLGRGGPQLGPPQPGQMDPQLGPPQPGQMAPQLGPAQFGQVPPHLGPPQLGPSQLGPAGAPRVRAATYSYDMTAAASHDAMVRRIIWIAVFVVAAVALVVVSRLG